MVCNSWYLRGFLAVVFGLISHSAFAQSAASSSCNAQSAHAVSGMGIGSPTSACKSLRTDFGCSASTQTISGTSRSGFLLRLACMNSSGNVHAMAPYSFFNGAPALAAGVTRSTVTVGGLSTYFYWQLEPDPEPECPGPSAPEFTGWKAPTANGSGFVCIDGCGANIALQAPPLPLFSGAWTGETCTPSPSNSPEPAGDPNDNPCTPGAPECPGTGDPSDPESPPGTGGGGIQCDTPPVCNADGVTCSMLYQQWRGRCETEYGRTETRDRLDRIGDSLDDGFADLSDGLGSLGDKVDAVGTKVDAVGDKVDAVGDKVGEVNQSVKDLHADLETGFSTGGIGDPGDAAWGSVSSSTEIGVGDLDASGMGFPRVCPVFQNVNLNFGSIAVTLPFADFDMHCSLLEWLGYIIVAFSAFWAARVLLDV